MNQEMGQPLKARLKAGRHKEIDSPLKLWKEMQPCRHLNCSPLRPVSHS